MELLAARRDEEPLLVWRARRQKSEHRLHNEQTIGRHDEDLAKNGLQRLIAFHVCRLFV